ncbi:sporulation integral membrane protein YlbJ [Fuchsiella alkaliacetigena]|uniref:sporulation integral membrane protein YlbJ n=1 Tax=Fuchsiella alkaliacetigena TaxID=957042 RepID=UPI00200A625B|nr:sporulation integral membrane protein YlbJ [Fuchsiella alkaliacetigena]MCK8825755.1 sporulation integral membrane protein YlbJ [Fuchsiella alkaliacetigena]
MSKITQKGAYLKAAGAIFITISFVIFSEAAFRAALQGLNTWWEVVFPALLPFFIMSEILMGLGAVNFLGALLEPLMRPLFKLPGVGAFAFAMGLAAGYPIGAKITGDLRRQRLCTQVEGERLVAFCNTADPLFLIGAVAVGMFGQPELGVTIAMAHYIACILVGFALRFYQPKTNNQDVKKRARSEKGIIKYSLAELYRARKEDARPLSQLLGDAVIESVNTLLLIGGFIVLFSVITEVLHLIGFTSIVTVVLLPIIEPLNLDQSLILPIISGIMEITNGANLASQSTAPLAQQLSIASGIIAWSGLSVHAQVASMIQDTDIRMKPYFIARFLHAVLAALTTVFLFKPIKGISTPDALPVFVDHSYQLSNLHLGISYLERLSFLSISLMTLLSSLAIISLLIYLIHKIKIVMIKL